MSLSAPPTDTRVSTPGSTSTADPVKKKVVKKKMTKKQREAQGNNHLFVIGTNCSCSTRIGAKIETGGTRYELIKHMQLLMRK